MSTRAIGLDEFLEFVVSPDAGSVSAYPEAFFVGVLLGSPRRTMVTGEKAVLAHGIEEIRVVNTESGAVIA